MIERLERNGYRARGAASFALSAKGTTREEALAKLRCKIDDRLKNGAELVGLEVGESEHPWMEFAGMFKDDPWIEDGKRSVEEYRRKVEEEADTPQVLENAVKVIYDKETDTLSIILRTGKVVESDAARPGLILDFDKAGRLVSIELLDASEQVKAPQSIEFALSAGD